MQSHLVVKKIHLNIVLSWIVIININDIICAVYKPHTTNMYNFLSGLNEMLQVASQNNRKISVSKHFNTDMLKSLRNHRHQKMLINLLSATCLNNNIYIFLKLFLTTLRKFILICQITTVINFLFQGTSQKFKKFETKRVVVKPNFTIFLTNLAQETWLPVYEALNVDGIYIYLIDILLPYFLNAKVWKTKKKLSCFLLYLQVQRNMYSRKIMYSDNGNETIWDIVNNE